MEYEHLRSIARLSQALWADPHQGVHTSREALAAISILQLPPEKEIKKAVLALIDRAIADPERGAHSLNNPFFRLSPSDRVLLCALHTDHWQYSELAQILDCTPAQIEKKVWTARTRLATYSPAGSTPATSNCLEYDFESPWTQRFLDDQLPKLDRISLQNHLMICEGCRSTLKRSRDLYFQVEKLIPKPKSETELQNLIITIEKSYTQTQNQFRTERPNFLTSLKLFMKKRDIQLLFGVGILFLVKWIWL